jgi:hypothetical protein
MPSGDGVSSSRIDSAAFAFAVLACALALMLLPGPFIWLASIGGLILLSVLFAYDQDGYRSIFQSLVFAAVCGFCLMLASAIVFVLRAGGTITAADPQIAGKWLPLTCAFGTVLFWAIDRARMSGRETVVPQTSRRTSMHRTLISEVATPVAQSSYVPPPPVAQPAYVPPQPPPAEQTWEQPVAPPRAETVVPQPAPAGFIRPASASIIPVAGKETMIYIALVGEGLNVLRSVRAEHLGRDFYKIVEPMPEGETWEYQPGQVVRCKKKNLSTGKGLVAVEEAPRAS